jgi:hypothetical protein
MNICRNKHPEYCFEGGDQCPLCGARDFLRRPAPGLCPELAEAGDQIKIIELWPPEFLCGICEVTCGAGYSVPIYEDEIVPDDYKGEWGGMPVCPTCFFIARGIRERYPNQTIPQDLVKKLRNYR